MKKTTILKAICIAAALGATAPGAFAQIKFGDNPGSISVGSLVDMESTNKGVIMPRIALTGTSSISPLPAGTASGTMVYNTATVSDVTPGYYYWNSGSSKWIRMSVGTDLSATAPMLYNSATGVFSMPAATTAVNGYLTSTDWNTFNNKLSTSRTLTINGTAFDLSADRSWSVGTVTGFSAGSLSRLFSTSTATATSTPALSFSLSSQSANLVFAGPTTGGAAAPTFRSLVAADIPSLDWTKITTGKPTTLTGYGITMNTARILGRTTAANGSVEEISIGSGLSLASGTLSATNSGTVTTVSVASANGFAGTVANATSTPALTLSTTVTGLLKGNGTAISAATAGTDYLTPTGSAASLTSFPTLNQNTTGSAAKLTTGRTIGITGDITYTSPAFNGSANVTAAGTISANAVTYAKMQAVSTTSRLLGSSSTTTPVQEITIGSGLTLTGTTLSASGGSGITSLTGDVTASGSGSVAATIANSAVTYAKIQNVSAKSLLGNYGGSANAPREVKVGQGLNFTNDTLNSISSAIFIPTNFSKTTVNITSSTTWTVPDGVYTITVEAVGGSGGGGGTGYDGVSGEAGASGGGGAGEYAGAIFSVIPGTTITINIGAAGSAGAAGLSSNSSNGQNGGNGGNTSVVYNSKTMLTANGGNGGNGTSSTNQTGGTGGAGGTGSNANYQSNGGNGGNGGNNGGSAGSAGTGLTVTNGSTNSGGAGQGGDQSGSTGETGIVGKSGQVAISYYKI